MSDDVRNNVEGCLMQLIQQAVISDDLQRLGAMYFECPSLLGCEKENGVNLAGSLDGGKQYAHQQTSVYGQIPG